MTWHRTQITTTAALTAATVIMVGLVGCSSNSLSSGASGPVVKPVAGKLTASQASRLDRGITASTVASEAVVIATEVQSQFIAKGRTLLPAGAHLRIDAASFRQTNAGTATVQGTVSGPDAGRWLLLLVREGGQWLLIGTRRMT